MFTGHSFLVSPAVSALTVAALTQHGGAVVYDLDGIAAVATVTYAIVADTRASPCPSTQAGVPQNALLLNAGGNRSWAVQNGLTAELERRIRAERIPVLYELWVHHCLRERRLCSLDECDASVIALNPRLFAGLRFTTTQLPLQLKANLVAILQFYGADYHRDLMDTTDVVVYSHMQLRSRNNIRGGRKTAKAVTPPRCGREGSASSLSSSPAAAAAAPPSSPPSAAAAVAPAELPRAPTLVVPMEEREDVSAKLAVARARGIACVTPQWVQQCLNAAMLLPFTAPMVAEVQAARAEQHRPFFIQHEVCGSDADGAAESAEMEQWLAEALTPPSSADLAAAPTETGRASKTPSPQPPATPALESATTELERQPPNVSLKRARDTAVTAAVNADPAVRAALRLADRFAANGLGKRHRHR